MKYSQFKQDVMAFVNRNAQVFSQPNTDYVLTAMNSVRRFAQREYAFNLNRKPAFVEVSMIGQSLLTDFYGAPDGDALVVKQIDNLFEYGTAAVEGTTVYFRSNNIRFDTVGQMAREVAALTERNGVLVVRPNQTVPLNAFCYLQGVKLYHSSLTVPTWIMADVIEFLPDHNGGTDEDIFLTYFADWLKWATIFELNQYLNKADRFSLDIAVLDRAWESVRQFDAQQAVSTGSISLD